MYYSGLEIIEIAIRIEENGEEFYTAAAEMIRESNDVKGLFYDLAEKELTHIAIFQKMADKFEPESFEFSKDEASGYIGHLADTHILAGKMPVVSLQKPYPRLSRRLRLLINLRMTALFFMKSC